MRLSETLGHSLGTVDANIRIVKLGASTTPYNFDRLLLMIDYDLEHRTSSSLLINYYQYEPIAYINRHKQQQNPIHL
jgi:hypothetical protein